MGYSTGMMRHRIDVYRKAADVQGQFGRNSGGVRYVPLGTFWAGVTFSKGMKALREGAVDAYDTVMVRMRWNKDIDHDCIIRYHDKYYDIQSLNEDFQDNQIQITAVQRPDKVVIASSSNLGHGRVTISDI